MNYILKINCGIFLVLGIFFTNINLTEAYTFTKQMDLGYEGEEVSQLQSLLKTKGFFVYPEITGYFGEITREATQKFQVEKNIVSSGTPSTTGFGRVGPQTLSLLNVLDISNPIIDSSPEVEMEIFSFSKDLGLEYSDADVLELQRFLNGRGFILSQTGPGSPGNETDYFGQKTFDALIRYQLDEGIVPVSGFFGPLTRKSINENISINNNSDLHSDSNFDLSLEFEKRKRKVTLSWSEYSDIDSYKIKRRETREQENYETLVDSIGVNQYVDEDIQRGIKYEYIVIAQSSDGVIIAETEPQSVYINRLGGGGGSSDPVAEDEVDELVVNAPTNLNINHDFIDQFTLSWTDNSDNEDYFEVSRSLDDVSYSSLATTTSTTYTDLSLDEDTYYYSVKAVASSTESTSIESSSNDSYDLNTKYVSKTSFDGESVWVDLSSHISTFSALTKGRITGNFVAGSGKVQQIIGASDKVDPSSDIAIRITNTGLFQVVVRENGTLILLWNSSNVVGDSQIHSFDITMDGGLSVEIDGSPDSGTFVAGNASTEAWFSNVNDLDFLAIGVNEDDDGKQYYLDGSVWDLVIYDDDTTTKLSEYTADGNSSSDWNDQISSFDGILNGSPKEIEFTTPDSGITWVNGGSPIQITDAGGEDDNYNAWPWSMLRVYNDTLYVPYTSGAVHNPSGGDIANYTHNARLRTVDLNTLSFPLATNPLGDPIDVHEPGAGFASYLQGYTIDKNTGYHYGTVAVKPHPDHILTDNNPFILRRSIDGGLTWTTHHTFDLEGSFIMGLEWLSDGSMITGMAYNSNFPGSTEYVVKRSVDGGNTWSTSTVPVIDYVNGKQNSNGHENLLWEYQFTELSPGNILVTARGSVDSTAGRVVGELWFSYSDDYGQTFSGFEPTGISASSNPGQTLAIPESNTLEMLFGQRGDNTTGGLYQTKAWVSTNRNSAWKTPVKIVDPNTDFTDHPANFGYPSIARWNDKVFGIYYDQTTNLSDSTEIFLLEGNINY
jgi:peptidoglycan hydrolase-like protein with peptidoglycan-binding domain